jgi:hypothetical protein
MKLSKIQRIITGQLDADDVASNCPGKLKCHGPASWCEVCGYVDLICDDPKCEQHLRWNEKQQIARNAEAAYDAAQYEADRLRRVADEARRIFIRHDDGPAVMVARNRNRIR